MPTRRSRKRKRAEYTAMLDRRSDDEIVEEMLAVLNPPSDQREAIRAEVMSHIEHIRRTVSCMRDLAPERFRSAKKRKKELGDYFKALRTAYGKFRKLPLAHDAYFLQKTFRQQLLEEIVRIKYHFDEIKVGHGHKPRDLWAEQAVRFALGLLCPPRWWETPREEWPSIISRPLDQRWWKTPREEWPSITSGGPWHQLSTLLYEALAGQSERDHVLNYMGQLKSHWPRLDDENLKRRADPDLYPRGMRDPVL